MKLRGVSVLVILFTATNCAVIPDNTNPKDDQKNGLGVSEETVLGNDGIGMAQKEEVENIRYDRGNHHKIKRCPSYDMVTSIHRFPLRDNSPIIQARRGATLLEINRQRCETCQKLPMCAKDINKCKTCKRICESLDEAPTNTESPTTPPTEMLQEAVPLEVRFAEESNPSLSNPQVEYFTVGDASAGPTMDLLRQLYGMENTENLDKFIILGKLKSTGLQARSSNTNLLIWDFARIFTNDGTSITPQIQSIEQNIPNNNKKLDLAQALNIELTKAIKAKKQELGKEQLSREEMDSLINKTMTQILNRNNENVGCSLEKEDDSIEYTSVRHQPILPMTNRVKSQSSKDINDMAFPTNPPVIQNTLDSRVGEATPEKLDNNVEKTVDSTSNPTHESSDLKQTNPETTPETITITQSKSVPQSDNHKKTRTFYESSEENGSSSASISDSGSLEDLLNPYLRKNNPPESVQQNMKKLVDHGINMSESARNSHGALQDNIRQPVDNAIKMPNIENIVEGSRRAQSNEQVAREPLGQNIVNLIDNALKIAELPARAPQTNEGILENPENGNIVSMVDNTLPRLDSLAQTAQSSNNLENQRIVNLINDALEIPNANLRNVQSSEPIMDNLGNPNVADLVDHALKVPDSPDHIVDIVKDSLKFAEGNQGPIDETVALAENPAEIENRFNTNDPIIGEEQATEIPVQLGMLADNVPLHFPSHISQRIPNTLEYEHMKGYEGMLADNLPNVYPHHLSKPIPADGPLSAFGAYENMPVDTVPPHFPSHISKPFQNFTGVTDEGALIIPVSESVGSTNIAERFGEIVAKRLDNPDNLKNFGTLVPLPENRNSNAKQAYFLGRGIGLPIEMVQNPDGTMHLSVNMERLCNCKDQTCSAQHIKTDPSVIQIDGPSNFNNMDDPSVKTKSNVIKRSSNMNDLEKNWGDVDEEFDNKVPIDQLEGELNKLNKNIQLFEEENKTLLSESTKALLQNVETAKNAKKKVKLFSKMLEFMKNIALTHK